MNGRDDDGLDFDAPESSPQGSIRYPAHRGPSQSSIGWTDEREENLRALWAEGLSCSQIARVLGGVTRNAVIGKVTRLGLRTGALRPPGRRTIAKPVAAVKLPPPPEPEPEELPALQLDGGQNIGVEQVNNRMCRWPIGDPAQEDFHFCGHKPKLGKPYCEFHARKAYVPVQPRAPKPYIEGLRRKAGGEGW